MHADELKQRMDQEVMVNTELEAYLKETHKKLSARVCFSDFILCFTLHSGTQLDEWMNKYELDIDEKQRELDNLKADRARDLSRLQGAFRPTSALRFTAMILRIRAHGEV